MAEIEVGAAQAFEAIEEATASSGAASRASAVAVVVETVETSPAVHQSDLQKIEDDMQKDEKKLGIAEKLSRPSVAAICTPCKPAVFGF
ncbi:hypothetical protein QQZ08_009471 [Neonectria magnoliae]|uniref:Uncharacterized protein n=1 Tax=Neonectria magnoliae TaxID=2732573 RepID=A0ABR1HMP5_9HYPO